MRRIKCNVNRFIVDILHDKIIVAEKTEFHFARESHFIPNGDSNLFLNRWFTSACSRTGRDKDVREIPVKIGMTRRWNKPNEQDLFAEPPGIQKTPGVRWCDLLFGLVAKFFLLLHFQVREQGVVADACPGLFE
jgi:hypothetical protein